MRALRVQASLSGRAGAPLSEIRPGIKSSETGKPTGRWRESEKQQGERLSEMTVPVLLLQELAFTTKSWEDEYGLRAPGPSSYS